MKEKVDDIWKRAYHDGDRDGFRKATEDMKAGTVDQDRAAAGFPTHGQIGRVTRANVYDKAYAFGFQSGYYDATVGGHRMDEINEIRRRAGLEPLDEVSRRNFLKTAAAGALAGGTGLGSASLNTEKWGVLKTIRRLKTVVPDEFKKELDDAEQKIMKW